MKPENRAAGELTSTEGTSNKAPEQTGLSNKKWNKAKKGLTGSKLASVEKTDAGLFVSLV